jgi:nicotinamidase-related amidase
MEKNALILIDMVNDFVTGKLKCDRAKAIIPNLQKLVESARKNNVPVIYANDAHEEGDIELSVWGEHAMKGTKEAEVIPELEPHENDIIIEKTTYSAFYNTNLEDELRNRGVENLVVTGLHTNICDRHTSADAFFRGFRVTLVEDAAEAFDEKSHAEGVEYIKTNYGSRIVKTDDLLREWENS